MIRISCTKSHQVFAKLSYTKKLKFNSILILNTHYDIHNIQTFKINLKSLKINEIASKISSDTIKEQLKLRREMRIQEKLRENS